MNIFKKIGRNLKNFAYNEDRSIASLTLGVNAQGTVSSDIGEHAKNCPVAEVADKILDGIQKDHCENAVIHADKLEAVDDGREQ